ncbi:MAG TPA: esterase [Candidatus Aphodousia gallistercoris]|nr:esterase [Candidatus Aphodousia gallistercoris]
MVIMYLHGFRSSPASKKGRILREAFGRTDEVRAPDLNEEPEKVQRILMDAVRDVNPCELCLVGSSLGGFYATWLAEKIGCKAVLLNPATQPWEVVKNYLGVQTIYNTDRTIEVKPEFEKQMLAMSVEPTRVGRYLVFLSTNDEVLDWHLAQKKYAACEQVLLAGNNHQIEHFEQCLPKITSFLRK